MTKRSDLGLKTCVLYKPEQDKLESPLRSEECYNALKECAKGKCPGSDGLSVEFYLHFWSLLGEEMTQFQLCFPAGTNEHNPKARDHQGNTEKEKRQILS